MKNRNFTNFNEFLNIRYIRSVKGIYMDPSDFDYMIERFEKISEENDKLKAEIEEYKNANRLWEKAYDDLVKLNKEYKDENEELKLYANNIANCRNINHETATEIKFRIHREKLIEHECLKDKEYIEHLKADIEQLKARNEANRHDLKLSVNAQSFIRRLENEVFSAECFNSELDNVEIWNLICLGNVADILEEMCDWKR